MEEDRNQILSLIKEGRVDDAIKASDIDGFNVSEWEIPDDMDIRQLGDYVIYLSKMLNLKAERVLAEYRPPEARTDWMRFLETARQHKHREMERNLQEAEMPEGEESKKNVGKGKTPYILVEDVEIDKKMLDMAKAMLGLPIDDSEMELKLEDKVNKAIPVIEKEMRERMYATLDVLANNVKLVDDEKANKVLILVTLLFLAQKEIISIEQKEPFGPIDIRYL